MIQTITYMAYWFTVAKTGQRKPFHQICICSKTMQRVSLELSHCLFMVFMERRVLNPFIKYSGYSKEHTAQCNQLRYFCRVCLKKNIIARLVHPDAKALKPVTLKRR